jgi:hypothetical protein
MDREILKKAAAFFAKESFENRESKSASVASNERSGVWEFAVEHLVGGVRRHGPTQHIRSSVTCLVENFRLPVRMSAG